MPSVHRSADEPRRHVGRLGRWVYVGLLSLFFIWVFDLFLGPMLRLRADGLVVSEVTSIAVPFPAQVLEVTVSPGARISRGDVLARVHSVELVQGIASLSARLADLQVSRTEIERRVQVAKAVLSVAGDRAGHADEAVRRIRDIRDGGNVAIMTWSQTLQERFNAKERLVTLDAEVRTNEGGLNALDSALAKAEAASADLRRVYNDGLVTAPEDGIVGLRIARPGDVVPIGTPLMVLYQPTPHVLAYLETGTLYSVVAGDRVRLSDGFTSTIGRVAEVLPVADALPEEFRRAFQPRGRSQVARIVLPEDAPFPLFAKVRLSGIGWLSPQSAVRVWVRELRLWLNAIFPSDEPRRKSDADLTVPISG